MTDFWRRCNFCKKEIPFSSPYYVCSVSTCNHKRTGLVFCSVSCWDGHAGPARHRDAWAVEEVSPAREEADKPMPAHTAAAPVPQTPRPDAAAPETDILVVVSKVKQYIRDRSGFNTSASTMDVLTRRILQICDAAIRHAEAEGRKTVMDRDVPAISILEKISHQ